RLVISLLVFLLLLRRSAASFRQCGSQNLDPGGACGFKHTNQYPFMSMTSCGNQPLFKDGKGCGSCYKVSRVLQTNQKIKERKRSPFTWGA
ncbi:Os10g0556100, partial [Oryza sativa Japonica Group]